MHYVGESKDYFAYNIQFQADLLRRFAKIFKENRFDLIHANHAQMPDLLLRILRPNLPIITTVHTTIDSQRMGTATSKLRMNDLERSEKMTFIALPLLHVIEREYLRRGSNVIFVSNYIRQLYLESYSQPKVSQVIHNGVDHLRFRPRQSEECLEHFPQFAGMDNVILFSGRMIALKGLNVIIEAFSQIRKKIDAHLVLAGTGKTDAWKRMLRERDVPEDEYTFLGKVPYQEMPWLYPLASVFVLPSYSESFPMTILEAMACGVPVVASMVGGIPEMVRADIDGKLVLPGDPKALYDGLLQVLADPMRANKLASNARERVVKNLNSKLMAIRTGEMYQRALECAR
jgi:glycosyltransferase involved in cell wall biosynthesis